MPPIIREGWARSLQIAADGRISRARGTRGGLRQPPPGFSGVCRDFPRSFRVAQHQAGRLQRGTCRSGVAKACAGTP